MKECIVIINDNLGRLEYKQELIRCRDCYFYNQICEYCIVNSKLSYDDYLDDKDFYFYVDADDYCSKAERKDAEE